ncbi:response regulator transcription factor [Kineothrix sp. MB12-C1]|uniref:response regulator transcription factor n=1 Tax=Kineothrix sp. MB12-C1 TaxID=3070215 RepID=UPI0027D23609|nr:response regulator [Kineothrix sp. MB12-C1]WMC91939.1 response regulator [Kineothrix sp. MB12-C1]
MIKMLLADDEPIITRGIGKLVDWEKLGIEIIGAYEDGRKALEAIVHQEPDIALLDISMPGMTGVEVLKECKAMKVSTRIVFISGFQDFEYAKAALQHGAVDYLLKPIIKEELLKAVEKCIVLNQGEYQVKQENKEQPLQENEIDYRPLVEAEDTIYVPIYAEVVYKKEESGQMKKLIHFSFKSFLEEYLRETQKGITFLKEEKIVIVLKGVSKGQTREIIEGIWTEALRVTGHRTFFVIGEEIHSMGEIPGMFARCLEREGYLFFADQMQVPIITLGEKVFAGKADSDILSETRQKLWDAVIAQNTELAESTYKQYGKQVCRMAEGKKEDACFYLCTAVRLIEEKCVSLGLAGRNPEMKELLETGRSCNSFNEMLVYFEGEFKEYLAAVKSVAVNNEKREIIKAKEYIENHYKENLSLGVLAEEMHMNPYYFSSFFKKNAGENFKDYVNRIRINHAVSLLLSTDRKVYEIASEVGFGDIRAFNEAFQRIYKETPSNYRKRVSK